MVLKDTVVNLDKGLLWANVLNHLEEIGMLDIDVNVYQVGDDGNYMVYYEKLKEEVVNKNTNHGYILISLTNIDKDEFRVRSIYTTKDEIEAIKSLNRTLVFSSVRMFVNTLCNDIKRLNVI